MKILASLFLSLLSASVFATPAAYTCVSVVESGEVLADKTANIPFTLGKIAFEGRSETFVNIDPLTQQAVRDFFHSADYVTSVDFVFGQDCTRPLEDNPGELEYSSTRTYKLNAFMFDIDYSFCPTALEVKITSGGSMGFVKQILTATYLPDTNPGDAKLCSQASGQIPDDDGAE